MSRVRYSGSDITRQVRVTLNELADSAKSNPDVFADITPPSGKKAGVDAFTEVNGFRRDASVWIEAPITRDFADGASQQELYDYLKKLPDSFPTRTESAGPFLMRATQMLTERLAPDVVAAAKAPEQQVPADDFKAVMASYADEAGYYKPDYLNQGLKDIGKPDMLTERNFGKLLKAIETHADRANSRDRDGMDYYWPDVTDHMNQTFTRMAADYKAKMTANAGAAGPPVTEQPTPPTQKRGL